MQPELKYGMIGGGLISILFYVDEITAEQYPAIPLIINIIVFALLGILIHRAMKEKKDQAPRMFPFPKALLTGAITAFYLSVIAGGYAFCYVKYMNPDKTKQVIEINMKDWKAQNVPPDQIELRIKKLEAAYSPMGQLTSTIGVFIVLGLLITFILSFVMKSKL